MFSKLRPFRFERPDSIREALSRFAESDDALYLGGGTALVSSWRSGAAEPPATVISLDRVLPRGIDDVGTAIRLGAATSVADLLRSPALGPSAMRDALAALGTPQVRERATVAGNIGASSWGSTLLPALLVGQVTIEGWTPNGAAIDPSLEALLEEAPLPRGALVTSLTVPVLSPARGASAATRLGTTADGGQLLLSAAAAITVDGEGAPTRIRLSVSPDAEGHRVLDLVADGEGLRAFANRAIAEAGETFVPPGDLAGSARYRAHLVRVVTRRVLEQAVRRHLAGAPQAGAGDGAGHRGQWTSAVARDRAERDASRGPAGTPEPHGR